MSARLTGFYAVFLKDLKCGDLRYGRHYYDYQEGTLVFVSPGQVLGKMCIRDSPHLFQQYGGSVEIHLKNGFNGCLAGGNPRRIAAVSYTHLDVYKRQPIRGKGVPGTTKEGGETGRGLSLIHIS